MEWGPPLMAHLDPDGADALRDVLGLLYSELRGDERGTDAILASLDADQARYRLRVLACLAAAFVAGTDPEQIPKFIRESGLMLS